MERWKRWTIAAILGLLWAADCLANETIVLQLRWDHQFQFAGYYAAKWQGYYAEEGLEVKIRSALTEGGRILSAVEEVAAEHADFGIGAADILKANDQGPALSVVATIFQQSAAAFYLKQDTPFRSLADLTRLRVARRVNDLIDVELQAMLLNEGIEPAYVPPHEHQPGLAHLLSDRIQVLPGYRTSTPYHTDENGTPFREILPADYGVDFYGDSLFTRTVLTQNNPELVERFRRASLKGWQYALNHPEEMVVKISNELPRRAKLDDLEDFNRFQVQAVTELSLYPIVAIGNSNPERWRRMHAFLKSIGQVQQNLNLRSFIFDPERLRLEKQQRLEKALVWLAIVVVALFGGTALWTLSLKRQVAQRTLSLQQELAERQQIEKALRSNEQLLRKIAENYPSYLSIIEADLTVGFTSGKEFTKMRLNPDTFVGVTLEQVFREQADLVRSYYQRVFFGQESTFELYINNQYQLYHALPLYDEEGNIPRILVVVENITERKQAEKELARSVERFSLAVKIAELIVAQVDCDLRYQWIYNPHPQFDSSAVLGKRDDELGWSEGIRRLTRFKQDIIQRGESKREEITFELQAGPITYDIIGEPLFDEAGQIIGLTTAALNITKRKEAEERLKHYSANLEVMIEERTSALNETQEKLLRQEKLAALGQLAGSVAHELRHPLGVLSNAVYFLKMSLPDVNPTISEYLEMLTTEIRKSDKIISDLLDFSRNHLTGTSVKAEIQLAVLLAEVLAEQPPPEGIEIFRENAPELPPLFADAQQLKQVLVNLLLNAYQAMPDGGTVSVNSRPRVVSHEGSSDKVTDDGVIITISDTGCGMAPETLEKVFEPLFTTRSKGIGLGLAICKSLVETNGGEILVESVKGRGSTFTLKFPSLSTDDPAEDPAERR